MMRVRSRASAGKASLLAVVIALAAILIAPLASRAQSKFFEGKTVRLLVGFSAGGGYDTYSRAIARHLSRHIPGNPAIIVDNMPGAASLIAANQAYRAIKPDGLTIVNFHANQIVGQVIGREGIEFDARKFLYLGVPVRETAACALTRASGITSLEKWLAAKPPVKLGSVGLGDTSHTVATVLQSVSPLPIQLVRGYKGTAEIRLAAEGGEIAGACWQWESIKVTWRKALEAGEAVVVLQVAPKPLPDLPNVPLAASLAKTEEARQLIQAAIIVPTAIARVYALPPGTPADRVQTLRTAFMATLRDPEFVADAKRANLDIDPIGGEELQRLVQDLFKLDPAVAAKLKGLLR